MIVTQSAIRHSGLEPESSPRRLHTDRVAVASRAPFQYPMWRHHGELVLLRVTDPLPLSSHPLTLISYLLYLRERIEVRVTPIPQDPALTPPALSPPEGMSRAPTREPAPYWIRGERDSPSPRTLPRARPELSRTARPQPSFPWQPGLPRTRYAGPIPRPSRARPEPGEGLAQQTPCGIIPP